MIDFSQIIHRTADDSYVITKNGMPYHVYPYAAEFAEEWDAVFAYAEAHPECVTEEQPYVPPVPTLDEAKAAKLSEINAAADRAIATATYPDREISTFDKQEAEAMPPILRLQRHSFRRWRRLGVSLCPTSWNGYSPRPTPSPWRPVQLSDSGRR